MICVQIRFICGLWEGGQRVRGLEYFFQGLFQVCKVQLIKEIVGILRRIFIRLVRQDSIVSGNEEERKKILFRNNKQS